MVLLDDRFARLTCFEWGVKSSTATGWSWRIGWSIPANGQDAKTPWEQTK